MADEAQMTNLADDATGQPEVNNDTPQDDNEALLNSDFDEELEQPEEESDDIDVDGKKFSLPKSAAEKLKAERMMHADYTRKTQEVATQRQQIEARAAEMTQQHQQNQQYIQEVAKVVAIDDQLAQYQELDWQALIAANPVQAMQLQQQQKALESQRHQAVQAVTQKQQQNALNEKQAIAKQVQEADAYFKREIQGWSNDRSDQLLNYGVAEGIPGHFLSQAVVKQPAFAKILHKAELYDQIVKKQTPAASPPPQAKPAAKVGGNASVKKDPSKMTDKEFAEYRRRTSQNRRT